MAEILAEFNDTALQPGEFTARKMFEVPGNTLTFDTIASRLRRKVKRGELLARPIVINGAPANAYRKP